MDAELREMLLQGDEVALEEAYNDGDLPHSFAVDWRADDADIVSVCAACLNLPSLSADWRGEDLILTFEGREHRVPLVKGVADRHITLCTLNDVLAPGYEVRFVVCSHGGDTPGFLALPTLDWQALEAECPEAVAENFIDPRKLPNLMTELTDATLPPPARARYERMQMRNRPQPPPSSDSPAAGSIREAAPESTPKPWWKFW